ncbi:hypothetical protein HK096_009625 [Nowakowskiella sp. JEL0078]|nr:hypothetical protein HK096_009625 [Nowakowskiella sp. JEL0078]
MQTVHSGPTERPVDLPRTRLIHNTIDTSHQISTDERLFPWATSSKPPLVTKILCKNFLEYPTNSNLDNLVSVRLLDGFSLQSVTIKQRKEGRPDKSEIILTLPWLPNVTIQYVIKTTYNATQNLPLLLQTDSHSNNKPPLIQLNVLAHYAFAIFFIQVNVQDLYANSGFPTVKDQNLDTSSGFPTMRDKLVKLHAYLKEIYEMDDLVRVVASFNSNAAMVAIPQESRTMQVLSRSSSSSNFMRLQQQSQIQSQAHFDISSNSPPQKQSITFGMSDQPNNYWNVISQIMHSKANSFQKWESDIIFSSVFSSSGSQISTSSIRSGAAASTLRNHLMENWATFSVDQHTYVRFQFEILENGSKFPVGLIVLTLHPKTDKLTTMRLLFFAVSVRMRRRIVRELIAAISDVKIGVEKVIMVCKKPVRFLAILYSSLESELLQKKENENDEIPFDIVLNSIENSFISPKMLKCYLRHKRWIWAVDNDISIKDDSEYLTEKPNLAFQILYSRRIREGFIPIFENSTTVTLYRELEINFSQNTTFEENNTRKRKPDSRVCCIQYVLHRLKRIIATELWMEPVAIETPREHKKLPIIEYFNRLSVTFQNSDSSLVNNILSFDLIHICGDSGYFANIPKPIANPNIQSAQFSISSLLSIAPFVTIGYTVPKIFNIPEFRDFLHVFFFEALSEISSAINSKISSNEPIEIDLLSKIQSLVGTDHIIHPLSRSDCFLKVTSPDTLLLTFLPNFSHSNDTNKTVAITTTCFECSRPSATTVWMPHHDPVFSNADGYTPIKVVERDLDGTDEYSYLVATGNGIQRRMTDDNDEDLKACYGLEGEIANFSDMIGRAYQEAFSRTVYAGLLKGVGLSKGRSDIDDVFEVCIQADVDIDVTSYINVHTLISNFSGPSDIYLRSDPFLEVLSKYFQSFEENGNIYFHNPIGQKTEEQFLICARSPLFLRTEISFSKVETIDAAHSHISLHTLPKSYRVAGDDDPNVSMDYTPDKIGTENSPIENSDGTKAVLHFCFLSIPSRDIDKNSSEFEIDTLVGDLPATKRKSIRNLVKDVKSLLHNEIIYGLLQLIPFYPNPIKLIKFIDLELQKLQNDENSQLASFSWSNPLQFIRKLPSGLELLKEKLVDCDLGFSKIGDYFLSSGWKKNKPKEYNVVKSKTFINGTAEITFSNGNVTHDFGVVNRDPTSADIVTEENYTEEFWVICEIHENVLRTQFFTLNIDEHSRLVLLEKIRNYIGDLHEVVNKIQLLLELNEKKLASFRNYQDHDSDDDEYTSIDMDPFGSSRTSISSEYDISLLSAGRFACPMVFQHIFYLHPRVKSITALSSISTNIQGLAILNRKNMYVSVSGTNVFYIQLSTLDIEVEGSGPLVYAAVTAREEAMRFRGKNSFGNVTDADPFGVVSPRSRTLSSSAIFGQNTHSPLSRFESAVTISVFGICAPGTDITEQFVTMIETRLNQLTQSALIATFGRNVSVKLNASDIDFLLPPIPLKQVGASGSTSTRGPIGHRRSEFNFPSCVRSPYMFMLLLRQNLLIDVASVSSREKFSFNSSGTNHGITSENTFHSGYLHAFLGPDVKNVLRKQHKLDGSLSFENVNKSLNHECEVQLDDFTFLYSGTLNGKHPSHIEQQIGNGIATLSFNILDRVTKKIISTIPALKADGSAVGLTGSIANLSSSPDFNIEKGTFSSTNSDISSIYSSPSQFNEDFYSIFDFATKINEADEHNSNSTLSPYSVSIDIWCHTGINVQALLDQIILTLKETLDDYLVEFYVNSLSNSLIRLSADGKDEKNRFEIWNDYSIEKTVPQQAIPIANSTPSLKSSTRMDGSFVDFMELTVPVLDHAFAQNNPSVQSMSASVNLPSWIIEDFTAEVKDILTFVRKPVVSSSYPQEQNQHKFNVHLPVVAKKMKFSSLNSPSITPKGNRHALSPCTTYELYNPTHDPYVISSDFEPEDSYICILGLPVLSSTYGMLAKAGFEGHRRKGSSSSVVSSVSEAQEPVFLLQHRNTSEDTSSIHSAHSTDLSSSFILNPQSPSRRQSLINTLPIEFAYQYLPLNSQILDFGCKNCFVLVSISTSNIRLITYNVNPVHYETLFKKFSKILSWNNLRMQYLERELFLLTPTPVIDLKLIGSLVDQRSHQNPHQARETRTIVAGAGSFGGNITQLKFESSNHEATRKLYSMDSEPLQYHAVEFLDSFIRESFSTLAQIASSTDNSKNQVADQCSVESNSAQPLSPKPDTSRFRAAGFLQASQLSKQRPQFTRISGSIKGSHNISNTARTFTQIALVLRSIQLFHFARYPIIFSNFFPYSYQQQRETEELSLLPLDTSFGFSNLASTDPAISWHKELIKTFSNEYIEYLKTLGLETSAVRTVEFGSDGTGFGVWRPMSDKRPQYSHSSFISFETEVVYLLKTFDQGVVIFQIGIDGIHFSVHMYSVRFLRNTDKSENYSLTGSSSLRDNDSFTTDCQNLRSQMHLNSFAFDFHIRQIHKIILSKSTSSVDVNLIEFLRTFANFNTKTPSFANCRLHQGICSTNAANLSGSIFQYIVKNPQRYGFQALQYDDDAIGCFLTSQYPDFRLESEPSATESSCSYTIIVYYVDEGSTSVSFPLPSSSKNSSQQTSRDQSPRTPLLFGMEGKPRKYSSGHLTLNYFVMVVNDSNYCPNENGMKSAVLASSSTENLPQIDPLSEYLTDGYYFSDIIKKAERKIEELVEKAVQFFGRDSLWQKLLAWIPSTAVRTSESADEPQVITDWMSHFLEKISSNSRSILAIDPDLITLFGQPKFPYSQMLDYLKTIYSNNIREFIEILQSHEHQPPTRIRYLIIINPSNNDYLVLFTLRTLVLEVPVPIRLSSDRQQLYGHLRRKTIDVPASPIHRPKESLPYIYPDMLRAGLLTKNHIEQPSPGDEVLDVSVVSREGVPDNVEYVHMSEIVNAVSFWVWSSSFGK